MLKRQVPLLFGIGPKTGTGVEDRTLLIFFVREAPSPDDNPGMVPQDGIEPPLALYIRQPRCHCATGASIRSFRDRVEMFPTGCVAQFVPTRLAQAEQAFLIRVELFTASFAFHKLARRAGFEPAHFLINSQAPYQLGYLRTTWWVRRDSNSPLRFKRPVLRHQSFGPAAAVQRLLRGNLVRAAGFEPAISSLKARWLHPSCPCPHGVGNGIRTHDFRCEGPVT